MTVKFLKRIIRSQTKQGSYASLPFMVNSNGINKIMWFEYDMYYSSDGINILIRHIYTLDKDCAAIIKSNRIIEVHTAAIVSYDDFDEHEYYAKLIKLFTNDDLLGSINLLRESESEESLLAYNFLLNNLFDTANQ